MENMEVSNIINNVTESVNSDSDGDDDMENIILKTNPSMLEQLKQSNAAEAFSAAMKTEKGSDGEGSDSSETTRKNKHCNRLSHNNNS